MAKIHLTLPHNDGQGWVYITARQSTDPLEYFRVSLGDRSEASDIHSDDLEKIKHFIRNQVPGTVIVAV